jgi:hypothetical protein
MVDRKLVSRSITIVNQTPCRLKVKNLPFKSYAHDSHERIPNSHGQSQQNYKPSTSTQKHLQHFHHLLGPQVDAGDGADDGLARRQFRPHTSLEEPAATQVKYRTTNYKKLPATSSDFNHRSFAERISATGIGRPPCERLILAPVASSRCPGNSLVNLVFPRPQLIVSRVSLG